MKVKIRNLGVDMEVKNKGTTLDVYKPDGKTRLGDLKISKSGLMWCNGKAQTGPKATWQEFIDWMNS
ncbi:MAG: hypothetical protein HLUCCO17_11325 [Saliniramus fredricksonii]|uniref:Uncharacterized protein n=1 Tax=Saliniramus fredricksonii TaxID=1653334 RepID=A0A0P7XS06_9HYPH|nr:hypothetical protein [Saliniramus fredricksonii]KPQ10364.1 MAG: hypothetical protein HLUCCO17_11325 [Saliniramus fredricksonii]SCC79648.1 hypothetical protein GA0071312_1072 [Saliniramus fredricksonii]